MQTAAVPQRRINHAIGEPTSGGERAAHSRALAAVACGSEPLGKLATVDLAKVKVGGEIGRRIDVTIANNQLVVDMDKDFLHVFREHKVCADGLCGPGQVS